MRNVISSIAAGACSLGLVAALAGCRDGYATNDGTDADRLNQAFNSKRAPDAAPGAWSDRSGTQRTVYGSGDAAPAPEGFASKRADTGAIGGSSSGSLGSDDGSAGWTHDQWRSFDSKHALSEPAERSDREPSHPVLQDPAAPASERWGYPYADSIGY
jgi:hypothetical protein